MHFGQLYNGPDSDGVVGKTSKEGLTVSGPGKGDGLRGLGVVVGERVRLELVDDRLGLQVKDLDARSGSSAQPVPVGGEDEGVDDVTGLQRVQVLGLVQVPKHGDTVLATGSGQGTVGGDGKGVDVTSVSEVVSLELALLQVPNLAR